VRVERRLFTGAAVGQGAVGTLYWFVSYEHAGTVMLVYSGLAFLLVAGYLLVVGSRAGSRPSDRPDADPGDEAAEEGAAQEDAAGEGAVRGEYYPSSSVWPFVSAAGVVVVGFGMVFGMGVASLGVLLLTAGIAGYASEANAKP
jgi:hypothetical protein